MHERKDRTFLLLKPTTEVYYPPNKRQMATLIAQGNRAEDWQRLLLAESFDCSCIHGCFFSGEVWLGSFNAGFLSTQDLKLPTGIYHSRLHNVTIAGAVAIHHVDYLSHMFIEQQVLLFRVGEITCSALASFGHSENSDNALKIANENAGRQVFAFAGMLSADAWLWSRYPHDDQLCKKLIDFTQKKKQQFINSNHLGFIGAATVVRHCATIHDCWIGEKTTISHTRMLNNLCILSRPYAPVQIEGVSQLTNGIIADGCKLTTDSKACNFVCDQNSQLLYGACLFDSYLGANSHVSGCEIRNSLLFPAHAQHHNNSFLIAATLAGQSNLAAAATLGSNHNSRAADGELQAARGFWAGLHTTLAYNSRFASFTLLSRGSYPAEMNIPYPFSLLSCSLGQVEIRPAYWLQHNIYALERNSWKCLQRDRRHDAQQLCYYDYLEADTAAEMLTAFQLLSSLKDSKMALLKRHSAHIIKPQQAIAAYQRMLIYYFVRTLYEYWQTTQQPLSKLLDLKGKSLEWQNVGGQIMSQTRCHELLMDVHQGLLDSWDEIHQRYREIDSHYLEDRYSHMQYLAVKLLGGSVTLSNWQNWCSEACTTATWVYNDALKKRQSDFADPFRQACYGSQAEQDAVLGAVENDVFLSYLREKQERWLKNFQRLNSSLEKLARKKFNGY